MFHTTHLRISWQMNACECILFIAQYFLWWWFLLIWAALRYWIPAVGWIRIGKTLDLLLLQFSEVSSNLSGGAFLNMENIWSSNTTKKSVFFFSVTTNVIRKSNIYGLKVTWKLRRSSSGIIRTLPWIYDGLFLWK